MKSFEKNSRAIAGGRHAKRVTRANKVAHDAVSIFMALVLAAWQVPAVALAEESQEPQSAAQEQPQQPQDSGESAAQPEPDAGATTPEQPQDQPAEEEGGDAAPEAGGDEGGEDPEAGQGETDEAAQEGDASESSSEGEDPDAEKDDNQEQSEDKSDESAQSITISFESNGGQPVEGADTSAMKVSKGEKATLRTGLFSRDGYKFVGWNTAENPDPAATDRDKAVPDGAAIKDMKYRYVVLTEENSTEEERAKASVAADGTIIAPFTGDDSAENDDQGRKIEAKDLSSAVKDDALKLYAQWMPESDFEEEVLFTAAADEDEDEGDETQDGDDGDDEAEGEDEPTEPEYPSSQDGSTIETITAKWLTADSTDNDDPALLYVRPSADEQQSVRLQVSYALSGEHNYEPGDVVITIPASIFQTREGKPTGTITIPFPQDPSKRADFNWKKVGDTYVLTNTKRMSAATKGYFQLAFSNINPHDMVDMDVSAPFSASIQVTTHKGNTIAKTSNELTAQFDTQAKLSDVGKRVSSSAKRVKASQVNIPEQLREKYADEEEFIVVSWYAWGTMNANTKYTIDQTDVIPSDKVVYTTSDGVEVTEADAGGFLIGSTAENGTELDKGRVYTGHKNGVTSYYYFQTAYPASQFEPDTRYTFHNDVTMTSTEWDPEVDSNLNPNVNDGQPDPKLTTTMSTSAQTTWSYTNPVWKDPTGHFMVFKNGNDDHYQNGKATNNTTHRGGSSRGDLHMWASNNQGWYGIYPSGMNDMIDQYNENGENGGIRLSYTIDTVAYAMPWMFDKSSTQTDGAAASRRAANYNRPVSMVTEDRGFSIGRYGNALEVGTDYEFVEVEFPGTPYVLKASPSNVNPDGSWTSMTGGDGTFSYRNDYDMTHWPDITLEIQRGGAWEPWATVSWGSGGKTITMADGSAASGNVVPLPADTQNFRTKCTLQNTQTGENATEAWQAGIDYDVRPVIKLKSTEAMNRLIAEAFGTEESPVYAPEMTIYNSVNMQAFDADGAQVASINKDAYDVLRGYTTDTMVYPSKSSRQAITDVDYDEQVITIHYSAKVEERSLIHDKHTYEQAVADGRLVTETHGYWRDLLPKGVTPDTSTVKLRPGDKVLDVYTIENYQDTGRTLLVVEAQLQAAPQTYRSGDLYYYEDVPSISFDAKYGFDEFLGCGNNIHNVISFESSNDHIGTIPNYCGEPDDPTLPKEQRGNISTPNAFLDKAKAAEEKKALTDLNPDRDTPSFVYAGTVTHIDIISAGRVSLAKDVQVNNDGQWSSGVYGGDYATAEEALAEPELQDGGNKRTVYEGGAYAYRLRMISATDTVSKNLVIYDSLENFYAGRDDSSEVVDDPYDVIDMDAPHWHGKFRGVDVSQMRERGCAPVVYYSTVENLQFTGNDVDIDGNKSGNLDLSNTAVWTPADQYTGSLDAVKAIAIDASKKANGSDFELQPLESATAIVRMQAPSGEEARGYVVQDAHAYNNAYLTGTTIDQETGGMDAGNFVRKDYTKVGLMEYKYEVTKTWDDDNDRDGMRPATTTMDVLTGYNDEGKPIYEEGVEVYDVAFHLLRDGQETGDVAYVRVDTGKALFPSLPYADEEGNKYRYSVREDEVEGYTASSTVNAMSASIVNKHVPKRVSVSGEKQWEGDDGLENVRPASIDVKLYAQYYDAEAQDYGTKTLLQTKTVKPDASGKWTYSFDNLYENQGGHKIVYSVQETVTDQKGNSYIQGIKEDGRTFVNTYHPYGDLQVSKTIEGTTAASQDTEFPFTFSFTTTQEVTDDAGATTTETVPVQETFAYDVLEGDTVVASGELTPENLTVAIKGGQSIHVKEIPEYVSYSVAEEQQPGFTQTATSNMSGTIQPNQTIQAGVTNTYSAAGSINLAAVKTLQNREIKNNQFRYQLYSLNEDGSEKELIGTAANAAKSGVSHRDDGTVESSTAPVTFGAIDYTQADHGKTFAYKMVEVIPDNAVNDDGVKYSEATDEQKAAGGFKRNGYTYDGKECLVAVTVTDNGDGTLSIVPTYFQPQERHFGLIDFTMPTPVDGATFENEYHASGDATLRAWKELQGRDVQEGEFTFELIDQDGAQIATAQNDASGTVTFDPAQIAALNFDETDIGKTYYYAIHEVAGDDPTVNYDDTYYGYALTIVDNEDGTLYAQQETVTPVLHMDGEEVANPISFDGWATEGSVVPLAVNTLKPGGLTLSKAVVNPDSADMDQEFTFNVKLMGDKLGDYADEESFLEAALDAEQSVGEPKMVADSYVYTEGEPQTVEFKVTMKANEKIAFKDLPAATTYQISEQTIDGWLLASQVYGSGSIAPLEVQDAVFTNKYQPGVTTAQFTGTKTLDGYAAAKDRFAFRLYEVTDEGQQLVQEVKTLDGGFVQFAPIEYSKDDPKAIGEHTYIIQEVDPKTLDASDDTVDYDTHKETVKVTVSLDPNDSSKLTSSVEYDNDGIQFANKTRPGNLTITKTADGGTTESNKDDVFRFKVTLSNSKGMPLGEGSQVYWYVQDADGNLVNNSGSQGSDQGAGQGSDQGGNAADQGNATNSGPVMNAAPVQNANTAATRASMKGLAAQSALRTPAAKAPGANLLGASASDGYHFEPSDTNVIATGTLPGGGQTVDGKKHGSVKWTIYQDGTCILEPSNGISGTYTQPNNNYNTPLGSGNLSKIKRVYVNSTVYAVGNAGHLFDGGSGKNNIVYADLRGMDVSHATSLYELFDYCYSLKYVDISTWNVPANCDMTMWLYYPNLQVFKVGANAHFSNWGSQYINANWKVAEGTLPGTYTGRQLIDMYNGNKGIDATWVRASYNPVFTIAFNANGGEGVMNSIRANLADQVTLPENRFYKDEMTFAGWSTNPNAIVPQYEDQSVFTGAALSGETVTLYAIWVSENSYLIHFDANGGYSSTQWKRANELDEEVSLPTPTHPNNKYFAGWNTKADGSGEYYNGTVTGEQLGAEPGQTVTLYAQWLDSNMRPYKVQHWQQNPDGNGYSLCETETFIAKTNTTVTPAQKTYTGFTPQGGTQTITIPQTGSQKVVQYYYDRYRYNVVFDGNGADSGQMNDAQLFYYGQQQPLLKNSYQKKGSIFRGWSIDPEGSGTIYTDCAEVRDLSTENGATVTLYAQWLSNEDNVLEPTNGIIYVECKAGQTIVLPDLPDGTTYVVEEVDVPAGWSKAGIVNETGAIVANQTGETAVTNKYAATGDAEIVAHKALERGTLDAGQFSFELLDEGGNVIQTATNAAPDDQETVDVEDGEAAANPWYQTAPVTFSPISYTQDDIGVHTYTVREVAGSDDAIAYDASEKTVTVTVSDAGHGLLSTQVDYGADGALFENAMKEASLRISKTALNAPDGAADQEFSFTVSLTGSDGASLDGEYPAAKYAKGADEPSETLEVSDGATITLKDGEHVDITGLPHGANYAVAEGELPAGWELVSSEGVEGALQANVQSQASFTNSYNPPPEEPYVSEGRAQIVVRKVLETDGDEVIAEDDDYKFELRDDSNELLQTKGVDEFGSTQSTVTFDEITYTNEDVPQGGSKTFVYKVSEVAGEDQSVKYDTNSYSVWVTATDDGNGVITTDVQYVTYEADDAEGGEDGGEGTGGSEGSGGSVIAENDQIKVELVARPDGSEGKLALNDEVSFNVSVENKGSADITNVVIEDAVSGQRWVIDSLPSKATAQANADAAEDATAAERSALANAYRQLLSQSRSVANTDVLAGKVSSSVTVTADGMDEPLTCACDVPTEKASIANPASEDDEVGSVTITNKIARTSVSGKKVWVDEGSANDKRPASITVNLLANGRVIESQEVNGDNNWEYSFDRLPDDGTVFTVEEVPVSGYTTAVTPTENGFDITNTRVPNAKLEFAKYLYGIDAEAANPRFSFTLVECDAQGTALSEGYTATANNSKFEGNKSTVAFELEDLSAGDHYYLVGENPADGADTVVDDMLYLAHVSVAEDGAVSDPEYFLVTPDGTVSEQADPQPAFFNNVTADVMFESMGMAGYDGTGGRISVYPLVYKYLDGSTDALVGGDFSFTLSGEGVEQTSSNDIQGEVAFYDEEDTEGLVFDAPGTYTYQITENLPEAVTENENGLPVADGIVYDPSTITMTVEVSQNDDGTLSANVVYTDGQGAQTSAPAFYNATEGAPSTPQDVTLNLSVDKLDAKTHEYVPGAKMALLDSEGSVVEQWTTGEDVYAVSVPLAAGSTYTLVEQEAPEGYDKVAPTEFTVALNGAGIALVQKDDTTRLASASRIALYDPPQPTEEVRVITKTNEKPTAAKGNGRSSKGNASSAKTGDTVSPLLATALVATALAALLAALYARKRTSEPRGKHQA